MELVKLVRGTRGQGSRDVEFEGIQTEVATGEFSKPRKGSDEEPKPIMADVPVENLPALSDIVNGIRTLLENSDEKLRRTFAKTYNAIAFSQAVAATATLVEDMLSPVFAEFGITDEALITTIRRNVSGYYGILVKSGKLAEDLSPEVVAEKKVKILRKMLTEADI